MRGFYTCDLFDCPPFTLFSADDCPRAVDILEEKFFEPQSMKLWCELCRQATSIIDIGAHVGVYSLAAASLRKDIPIYAFEPNPEAWARLNMHKRVNGFEHIKHHRAAIAGSNGARLFTWSDRGWISSGGHFGEDAGVNDIVWGYSFDGLTPLGDRPLIKIDVEGAEAEVFAGMLQTLERKPDIILETFSQAACDKINALILPLGYKVWFIDEYEGLKPRDRLTPADTKTKSFNHFLSVRYEAN